MKGNSNHMVNEADERKKMVELSRQSNFNIGENFKIKHDLYAQDTSSKVAFDSRKLSPKVSHDVIPKQDFKSANFKFGT